MTKTRKPLSPILLPTCILAIVLFSMLSIFVKVGFTDGFDTAALTWINSHASPAFDTFFVFVTQLAGVLVVSAITFALFGLFILRKKYYKAAFVALSIGGAAAIGFGLKSLFDRPRPDLWEWIVSETNFSFPSGHAIASATLALCLVVLLWRTKLRVTVSILAVAYVVVIGVSRLYLGVHFPTDILGGWLLSIAWVSLVALVLYRMQIKKGPQASA